MALATPDWRLCRTVIFILDKKQVRPYWADTSSNSMIDELIRKASTDIKEKMEELLQGKEIVVNFDEQIVFEQLDQDENAI